VTYDRIIEIACYLGKSAAEAALLLDSEKAIGNDECVAYLAATRGLPVHGSLE
jgi:hypothetical protein